MKSTEVSQNNFFSFLSSIYHWILSVVICTEALFGILFASIIFCRDNDLHRSEYVSFVVLFSSGLHLLFTVTTQREKGDRSIDIWKKNLVPLILFLGSVVAVVIAYPLGEWEAMWSF